MCANRFHRAKIFASLSPRMNYHMARCESVVVVQQRQAEDMVHLVLKGIFGLSSDLVQTDTLLNRRVLLIPCAFQYRPWLISMKYLGKVYGRSAVDSLILATHLE